MSATNTNKQQRKTTKGGPREGSVVWAMIRVLDGKRKPMTSTEILAEIQKRGLANKLAGKTPEASVAARLAVHVGIYFERPEKGKYQLKKGVTTKSIARQGTPADNSKPTPKNKREKPSSTDTRGRSGSKPAEPATQATSESDSQPATAPTTA